MEYSFIASGSLYFFSTGGKEPYKMCILVQYLEIMSLYKNYKIQCTYLMLYEGVLISPYPDLLPDVVGQNR